MLVSLRDPRRNQIIDGLRGLSIAFVLVTHFHLWAPDGDTRILWGRPEIDIRGGLGYYGVALFFVISGFLITGLSLRRYGALQRIDCTNFWTLRAARLGPMLGATLLLMVAFHLVAAPGFRFSSAQQLGRTVSSILAFRFPVLLWEPNESAWQPLWSLSVEEMFYLLFPFVCLVLNGRMALGWVGAFVIASGIFYRASGGSPYEFLGCVDLLALGCLLASLRPENWAARLGPRAAGPLGWLCAAAGVVIIFWSVFARHPFNPAAWAALPCAAGGILVLIASQLVRLPRLAGLALTPVSVLGVISYELYLIHEPWHSFLQIVLPQITVWPMTLLAIGLAALAYAAYSEPLNRTLRGRAAAGATGRSLRLAGGGAIAILLSAAVIAWVTRPRLVSFRLTDVAALPVGASEPLVAAGGHGAGDLVYLVHRAGNRLQVGIDHWGSGGPLSKLVPLTDLAGQTFKVRFDRSAVEVDLGGRPFLLSPHGCDRPILGSLGRNDGGFTSATTRAASRLVPVPG